MLEYKVCIGDTCQPFQTQCFALNTKTILKAALTHLQRLRENTSSEGIKNHHSKEIGNEIKSHRLKRNSRGNLVQPSTQSGDSVDQVAQRLVQSSFEFLKKSLVSPKLEIPPPLWTLLLPGV